MNQPTLEEILKAQLARQWAEQVQQFDAEYELTGRNYSSDPMRAAAEYILSHAPAPTMAEVEWDDEKHYLAEAEHPEWGKVIMLGEGRTPGFIRTIRGKENDAFWGTAGPYNLTPTGKRYELKEVQE